VSRKPSKKPKPGADSITVTKKRAAISQIYAAIWLWFHYDEPLSILALARNANDCYDAIGGHIGRPSMYKIWLSKQSRTFQDRANYVYEFIRHGRKDLKQSTPYSPKQGEMLVVDSIDCHNYLFGDLPPLMSAFNFRLLLERPDILLTPDHSGVLAELRKIKNAVEAPRAEFLQVVLNIASELRAKGTFGKPEVAGLIPMSDPF
jgi:hypothetical protein